MKFSDLNQNVENKYRPIPFWSWNEKLDEAETAEQVRAMHNVGIGGFFMHARGGLQTEYMGEEWFSNVTSATEEGKRLSMRPWAYDENGWPSGFGNGTVNGLGIRYQQKYLRMTDAEPEENVICKSGEHWFSYEVNPFYVDVLDKDVIKEFIKNAYEPYYERYGTEIEGFFTDEPQISRKGIPWSFVYEAEYKAKYNEDIYAHLEELFLPVKDYKATRVKFWKMVTDLFSEAFAKQIYDWCSERGLKLTGHLVLEDNLISQLTTNGACMPHYEYFHIPGMDWLGRKITDCLTARQVSSVAEQLDREAVLSETFALCGHNVSFAELKGIYEWQMVRGINLLCPHLEGYSLRGIRKRDYPPAMYLQQPWWSEYDKLINGLSREGMILREGRKQVDVLLIHPQTTAWSLYDDGNCEGLDELSEAFIDAVKQLERKHILFHLGDETIMERHARAEGGRIVIGNRSYGCVVMPCCGELLPKTKELLDEYRKQNGVISDISELPCNDITDDETISYTARKFDDCVVHYFVNSSPVRKTVRINAGGKIIDFYSGELRDFDGIHEFEPWGSLMIKADGTEPGYKERTEFSPAELSQRFDVARDTVNALTLDRCDYYFDGVLQEKNGYVLNICERANKLERKVKIHQDYHVNILHVPKTLYLVCETPEIFTIKINGTELDRSADGYYRDKSFKKIDICDLVRQGENVISFDCDFAQSEEFYDNMRKAHIFESEKNKLSYDIEIESVYLIGDFGVRTDGEWKKLDRDAVRYHGDFAIDKLPETVNLENIEQQGFPFFCGELTLEGEVSVCGENPALILDFKGVNAVRADIDGKCEVLLTDRYIPLQGSGKKKIKLTLINNLRNLLGPHHLKEGEVYHTGPASFYKESCVWNRNPEKDWDDDYCFVETV